MAIDEDLKEDLKDLGLGVLVTGVGAVIPIIGTPVAIGGGTYTLLQGRKVYKKLKKSKLLQKLVREENPVDKYFKPKKDDDKKD